jgi:ureidoglycolate dehydrogenase (NAD+)
MAVSEPRVAWEELRAFTREVFIRAGVPAEDADIEAEVVVWANLRGVDSHGVLRIPCYLEFINKGVMNTRPNIQILKETPATLVIDADHGLGPVVTTWQCAV